MEISKPNEFGAMSYSHQEIVARHGSRWFAAVNIALCEDGLYRQSTSMMYSYRGHGGPVFMSTPGYGTMAEAIDVGIRELLDKWPSHCPWEPQSAHEELDHLRRQIESRLRQPTLF